MVVKCLWQGEQTQNPVEVRHQLLTEIAERVFIYT